MSPSPPLKSLRHTALLRPSHSSRNGRSGAIEKNGFDRAFCFVIFRRKGGDGTEASKARNELCIFEEPGTIIGRESGSLPEDTESSFFSVLFAVFSSSPFFLLSRLQIRFSRLSRASLRLIPFYFNFSISRLKDWLGLSLSYRSFLLGVSYERFANCVQGLSLLVASSRALFWPSDFSFHASRPFIIRPSLGLHCGQRIDKYRDLDSSSRSFFDV